MLDLSVLPTPRLIDYGTSSVFGRHSTMEYHFSTISERIWRRKSTCTRCKLSLIVSCYVSTIHGRNFVIKCGGHSLM